MDTSVWLIKALRLANVGGVYQDFPQLARKERVEDKLPFVICTLISSQPSPILGNVIQDLQEIWRCDLWQKTPKAREDADRRIRETLADPPDGLGSSRLLVVSSAQHLSSDEIDTQVGVQGADTVFRLIRSYTLASY